MAAIGNNMSQEVQVLRDSFFGTDGRVSIMDAIRRGDKVGNGEVDYLKEILTKHPKAKALFNEFQKMNGRHLYDMALKRIERIEFGEVKEQDLEKVEGEICLLLGALEDIQKVKVLEKEIELEM